MSERAVALFLEFVAELAQARPTSNGGLPGLAVDNYAAEVGEVNAETTILACNNELARRWLLCFDAPPRLYAAYEWPPLLAWTGTLNWAATLTASETSLASVGTTTAAGFHDVRLFHGMTDQS